jgi:hypothetical protein
LIIALILAAFAAAGCERSTQGLEPAPLDTDPIVFADDFGWRVDYQAFLGSKLDAVEIDTSDKAEGTASLKVIVPPPGDPSGTYAGGAFTTGFPRNLSRYNALTFWAKSSVPSTLDVAGLGNDNTGTSKYEANWKSIPLTTSWTKHVLPIPLPAKLEEERGLFFMAEGAEDSQGHVVWFDEVKFETVATISNPRPSMASRILGSFVGATVNMEGTKTTFDVDGTDQTIEHLPGYFTFESSDESIVRIQGESIWVVGGGSATITAKLDTVAVTGVVTVNATAPPSSTAPDPTLPASDVISLFSNSYRNVPVDTWSTDWDQADLTDIKIDGNDVKAYTNLNFAGVEFASQTIDATAMTHFHLDVYIPNGTTFKVKLVDFGADGVFGGGDDREQELFFTPGTTPPLIPATWSNLDIPLADFTNLPSKAHLAQMIFSGASTAYVDNVYFHK